MCASQSLPTEIDSLLSEATRHRKAGAWTEAAAVYRQVLSIRPDFAEVHNELGNLLVGQRDFNQAQFHFESAVALRPDFAPGYHNLANLLWGQGSFEQALCRFEQVATLLPARAESHNNVANVLAVLGRLDEAALRYVQALTLNPKFAEAHNNLGNVLRVREKLAEAALQYQRAIELKPSYVDAHSNLANVLREQGRFDEAAEHLHTALALNPKFLDAYRNLAFVLTEQGKFDKALAQYERALAIDPNYADAHIDRAGIKTYEPGDPDLAALEALAVKPGLAPGKRARLHFALGKALDDVGQYDRAFQHWIAANALKRREIEFDETRETHTFQQVRELIDRALLERLANQGHPSESPIFILGMPRSGTTLVEQILASHPRVHAAGELSHLMNLAGSVGDAELRPIPYPQYLINPPADGLWRLGQTYVAQLPPLLEGKTRITDKMPGNFRYVGLIRLILPEAKIIHVSRNPVDTCVSCFKQLFTAGQTFSYDMAELGRAYRRYHELMEHWRSVLPEGAMLEVRYEDVVDNLEQQARRMLEFCGLPWDEACLRFHQTERPIRTASNLQVRQPVYRQSIGRWQRYQTHLGPLLAELNGLLEPK